MSAHAEAHAAHPPQAHQSSRVDEIIVSTFPKQTSGWLRKDLVERLRSETGKPVEHVVVEGAQAGALA